MLFAVSASYSQQALAAMIKNPSDREAAARQTFEKLGINLIGWYGLPSGPDDDGLGFMVIYDAPVDVHFAVLASPAQAVHSTTSRPNGSWTRSSSSKQFVAQLR